MKKIRNRATLLTVAALLGVLSAPAHAQQKTMERLHFGSPEAAATFDIERAKIANSDCSCFWLRGGSGEVAVRFYPAWSLVGSFAGSHASNVQPGTDVGRLTWLIGPRFRVDGSRFTGPIASGHGSHLFGQFLAGGTHGFDGVFPTRSGVAPSANSYALEAGGGLEISQARGFNLRAFEIDYVRTALPNSATNTQNDLRLAFGLAYSFKAPTR